MGRGLYLRRCDQYNYKDTNLKLFNIEMYTIDRSTGSFSCWQRRVCVELVPTLLTPLGDMLICQQTVCSLREYINLLYKIETKQHTYIHIDRYTYIYIYSLEAPSSISPGCWEPESAPVHLPSASAFALPALSGRSLHGSSPSPLPGGAGTSVDGRPPVVTRFIVAEALPAKRQRRSMLPLTTGSSGLGVLSAS